MVGRQYVQMGLISLDDHGNMNQKLGCRVGAHGL